VYQNADEITKNSVPQMFIVQSVDFLVGAIIIELLCDCHWQSTCFNSLRGAPRPRRRMLRVRIGFRRIHHISLRGRSLIALHAPSIQNAKLAVL